MYYNTFRTNKLIKIKNELLKNYSNTSINQCISNKNMTIFKILVYQIFLYIIWKYKLNNNFKFH